MGFGIWGLNVLKIKGRVVQREDGVPRVVVVVVCVLGGGRHRVYYAEKRGEEKRGGEGAFAQSQRAVAEGVPRAVL